MPSFPEPSGSSYVTSHKCYYSISNTVRVRPIRSWCWHSNTGWWKPGNTHLAYPRHLAHVRPDCPNVRRRRVPDDVESYCVETWRQSNFPSPYSFIPHACELQSGQQDKWTRCFGSFCSSHSIIKHAAKTMTTFASPQLFWFHPFSSSYLV